MGKNNNNRNKIAVRVGIARNLEYVPGTANKTVIFYLTANRWGKVASYSVTWWYVPWGGSTGITATTTSVNGGQQSVAVTYDIPSNAKYVYATASVASVNNTNQFKVAAQNNSVTTTMAAGYGEKITAPSQPSITMTRTSASVNVEYVNDHSNGYVQVQLIQQTSGGAWREVYNSAILLHYGTATLNFTPVRGSKYKARALAIANPGSEGGVTHWLNSDWGAYCALVNAAPETPSFIKMEYKGVHESTYSVRVSWGEVYNAEHYRIEYTTNKELFNVPETTSEDLKKVDTTGPVTAMLITSDLTGGNWWFRVFAVNNLGDGDPRTGENSVNIGQKPAPPTTWTYRTTMKLGDMAVMCWTHNSLDGSLMEYAKILWHKKDDDPEDPIVVQITDKDGHAQGVDTDSSKAVSSFSFNFDTSLAAYDLSDSDVICWKVQTKGVYNGAGTTEDPDGYSEPSTERQITVYEPPTLTIGINAGTNEPVTADSITGNQDDASYIVVESFPITITTLSGPQTQTPIGLDYEIVAEEDYEIIMEDGSDVYVVDGESIYKRYSQPDGHSATLVLGPGDIFLKNQTHYSIKATVAMSNGLTAEASIKFYTSWAINNYSLDADITIDETNLMAYIRPFCNSIEYDAQTGAPIITELTEGILISVYRREVNASFVPISKNLDVATNPTVIDIHPALDYARYRLVGIDKSNGTVFFEDLSGVEVGETGIVIHWNETWRTIDEGIPDYDEFVNAASGIKMGSLLKLPYNVDINDDMGKEATLISYAGRTYPVSYYGTQRSLTSKWTTQIPKADKESLNSVRRLAMYGGDSYVREPNGTGYWAALTLSYSITHNSELVPVNFNITRVEGDDSGVTDGEELLTTETSVVEQEETQSESGGSNQGGTVSTGDQNLDDPEEFIFYAQDEP